MINDRDRGEEIDPSFVQPRKSFTSVLRSKLVKKYNISQDHLHTQLMNKIIPIPSIEKK